MNFNISFPYSPSYKIHILIGLIIGLLLAFILIVLQPFNLNNFVHNYGEVLLFGFGIVKFLNYLLSHFIENLFYREKGRWTVWNEILFLLLSLLSGSILGYIYLDTVFEEQPLSFLRFILFFYYIILPIFPLIILPQSLLRYLLVKNWERPMETNPNENEDIALEKLTLKGQNAKDELTIYKEQLLFIRSVDNYVKVYYSDGETKTMMLRAKLSEVLSQAPYLVQPHRSYLINPKHLFKVKGNSQKAILTSLQNEEEIPIARNAYKRINGLFN